MIERTLAAIRQRMSDAADEEFAAGVRRFFKESVDPVGIRSADLQEIVRWTCNEVKSWPAAHRNKLCDQLWRSGRLEEGVLVCHLYKRFARQCGLCEWKLFERWVDRYVHNWAHGDGVASWLLAACIRNDPSLKKELPGWAKSKNRWKRRAAAVALLQEAKAGRSTEDILAMALVLAHDPDVMVQKGVGWLLKETYPARPDSVMAFLAETSLPRLVIRYAAEKMTPEHRAEVMKTPV